MIQQSSSVYAFDYITKDAVEIKTLRASWREKVYLFSHFADDLARRLRLAHKHLLDPDDRVRLSRVARDHLPVADQLRAVLGNLVGPDRVALGLDGVADLLADLVALDLAHLLLLVDELGVAFLADDLVVAFLVVVSALSAHLLADLLRDVFAHTNGNLHVDVLADLLANLVALIFALVEIALVAAGDMLEDVTTLGELVAALRRLDEALLGLAGQGSGKESDRDENEEQLHDEVWRVIQGCGGAGLMRERKPDLGSPL